MNGEDPAHIGSLPLPAPRGWVMLSQQITNIMSIIY